MIPLTVSDDEIRMILGTDTSQRPGEIERPIVPQPEEFQPDTYLYDGDVYMSRDSMSDYLFHDVYGDSKFPYGGSYAGGASDRFWLRETWTAWELDAPGGKEYPNVLYRADSSTRLILGNEIFRYIPPKFTWKSPVTMPRWASRCTLINDGVYPKRKDNGQWVWVIQFRKIQ